MRVVYGFVVSVKLWAAINCEKGIASCIHIIFFNSNVLALLNYWPHVGHLIRHPISVYSEQLYRNLFNKSASK